MGGPSGQGLGDMAEQRRIGRPGKNMPPRATRSIQWRHPLPAVFPGVGGFVVGVLGRHAPAQVHVEEFQPQLLDPLAQFREDDGDQMIPLRVHVAEGAADEDADGLQGRWAYALLSSA